MTYHSHEYQTMTFQNGFRIRFSLSAFTVQFKARKFLQKILTLFRFNSQLILSEYTDERKENI